MDDVTFWRIAFIVCYWMAVIVIYRIIEELDIVDHGRLPHLLVASAFPLVLVDFWINDFVKWRKGR